MEFRIEACIELQNARQRAKNEKDGAPRGFKVLTKANLARLIWPALKRKAPSSRMSSLIKEPKTIRPEWVELICNETGTDPNFLFGFPSKHDKDYREYMGLGDFNQ